MNSPLGDENFPILSGSYASIEMTETQNKLCGILKGIGKMSLVLSNSHAKFRTEKLGGLESYLYQINKAVEDGKPLTREELETLENETRYTQGDAPLKNQTEFLRFLLHNAQGNKVFRELTDQVIKEQLELEDKASNMRFQAEKSQADEIGN